MSLESRCLSFKGLRVDFSIARPQAHLRHRMLFLSSPLTTGFHWRKLLPELSELGCLCVLAQLPGLERTDAAPLPSSVTRARIIWGVLDDVDARMGGQSALWHLAAHGAACSTVLSMCATQPDSVRSLIQISPFLPETNARRASRAAKPVEAQRVAGQALSSFRAFSDFVARVARRPLPDYAVERMWAAAARPGARAALFELLTPADKAPRLSGFCPSIAIWGGSDPLMGAQARERLCALMPELETHVIRAAGHFPMETHSHALRDYLRGWLRYVG